jgi:hypothetical protein
MQYHSAALTFAGVLIVFKLWSVVLIYMYSSGDGVANFLIGTHVLWIAIPVLLLWAPAAFWFRMLRVRRRRKVLLESEWNVERDRSARR